MKRKLFTLIFALATSSLILGQVKESSMKQRDANTAKQKSDPVISWLAKNAIPITTVEPGNSFRDLQPFKAIIGNARAVALGESVHGGHEFLAFRNRLFEFLVEEMGFTAIAIESGLSESAKLYDYVLDGNGDRKTLVQENVSFGEFEEVHDLIQWIRRYNENPSHVRKVHFYGMDLPGGGMSGASAIKGVLTYLEQVDPDYTKAKRDTLLSLGEKLSYGNYTKIETKLTELPAALTDDVIFQAEERNAITASVADLVAHFERQRISYIARSSEIAYEWAYRHAISARQIDAFYRSHPPTIIWSYSVTAPSGNELPISSRDRALADNALWALEREGNNGRVLIFAHNVHVNNASDLKGFASPPIKMGQFLRSQLKDNLVIIGTTFNRIINPGAPPSIPPEKKSADSTSIDVTLASVGLPQFAINLHQAPKNDLVAEWLKQEKLHRASGDLRSVGHRPLIPGIAFDAFVFIETITAAKTIQ